MKALPGNRFDRTSDKVLRICDALILTNLILSFKEVRHRFLKKKRLANRFSKTSAIAWDSLEVLKLVPTHLPTYFRLTLLSRVYSAPLVWT